jgi:hypothetical protein
MGEGHRHTRMNQYFPLLRLKAVELIDIHGANAINKVTACTPLERAISIEMRDRGITNIRRLK